MTIYAKPRGFHADVPDPVSFVTIYGETPRSTTLPRTLQSRLRGPTARTKLITIPRFVRQLMRTQLLAAMTRTALLLGLALALTATAVAQDAPAPDAQADAGFEPIFDGKTLDGWEGDAKYWRVEDGVLVGEITPETLLEQNSFLVWGGGEPGDFELKLDFRIAATGNSGINYRSEKFSGAPNALKGYQFDIDGANQYTGQSYEERGRAFLALRGDAGRIDADGKARVVGSLGGSDALVKHIKAGDWNSAHLIARGNVMTHLINGHVMCIVVDDDAANRKASGFLGVQVHVGPPMKAEYRNIRLKQIKQ
jgi:hypothetical protein